MRSFHFETVASLKTGDDNDNGQRVFDFSRQPKDFGAAKGAPLICFLIPLARGSVLKTAVSNRSHTE